MEHKEKTLRVKVENGGRIVIPAEFRKALEIKPGDTIFLTLEDNMLQATTVAGAVKRARGLLDLPLKEKRSLADELLQERRREAALE